MTRRLHRQMPEYKVALLAKDEDGVVSDAAAVTVRGPCELLVGRFIEPLDASAVIDHVAAAQWKIDDKKLSRRQLKLTLPAHPDEVRVVTGLTEKPSFVQTLASIAASDTARFRSVRKDEVAPLGDGEILWLMGNGESEFRHAVRITVVAAPAAPAAAVPPVAPAPAAGSADAGPSTVAASSASGAGEDGASGEWQVRLGGRFQPYDDGAVQAALEAALIGRGEASARVTVRGQAYIIQRAGGASTTYRQVLASDPTRVRDVRRVVTGRANAAKRARPAPAPTPAAVIPPQLPPPPPSGAHVPAAAPAAPPAAPPAAAAPKARPPPAATPMDVDQPSAPPPSRQLPPRANGGDGGNDEASLMARVAAVRRRADATDPRIFDGVADVDSELAFLLRQRDDGAALRDARRGMRTARAAAPHGSVERLRLGFLVRLVTEQMAALPKGDAPSDDDDDDEVVAEEEPVEAAPRKRKTAGVAAGQGPSTAGDHCRTRPCGASRLQTTQAREWR